MNALRGDILKERWGAFFRTHKKSVRGAIAGAALLFCAQDALLIVNAIRADRPIAGLRLFGRNVSHLSSPALKSLIKEHVRHDPTPLRLSYQDQAFEIRKSDVGAAVDLNKAARDVIRDGRRGNIFSRLLAQDAAALGMRAAPLNALLARSRTEKTIQFIALAVNQDAVPLRPDFAHDLAKTVPPRDGVRVDGAALRRLVERMIISPPRKPVTIPVVSVSSSHTADELEPIRKEVMQFSEEPIKISSAGQILSLSRDELLGMLTVAERSDPSDHTKIVLVLRLDTEKLNKKLGEFAGRVEKITHAEFDDHDARVAVYAQLYSNTRGVTEIPTGDNREAPVAQADSAHALPAMSRFSVIDEARAEASPATSTEKYVYLTFDDGPNNTYHPLVLDILKKYSVKATFFLVGQNAEKYGTITARTHADGHLIGDHSLTHAFLPKLSAGEVVNEVATTKEILKAFNDDRDIVLFRPPYGGVSPQIKRIAKDLHMNLVLWSVDPRDWSEPSTRELVERVISHAENGSDILLHSNHLATVKALPEIITRLQEQGYAFKTLSE